ncbi:hypothetical protein JOM56_000914 [Amanita muscaria]
MYALCRGIWYFAVKAHHSIFRVESRLGQSVAYSSVYEALRGMAVQKLNDLKEALRPGSGSHIITVSDNIQAFVKPRLAGTAVEMQDADPEAFDLRDLIHRQALQERKTLTAEMILADIDGTHLENVAVVQIMDALVQYVPVLAVYSTQLMAWSEEILAKNPIPKNRHSKITPLATNSSDEMLVQEMKQGVLDFATTQMGIDKETLDNRCWIYSGDSKMFDQLPKLKKYLVAEEGDFKSFRWLVPLLELWHTKWTDLSRVIRTHWGKDFPEDPSTLRYAAKLAEYPTSNNLRKVDFHDGAHIINLTLDAHLLNLWEAHLETSDLVRYFETRKEGNNMPTFEELVAIAGVLTRRHATTQAHKRALFPREDNPNVALLGLPWIPHEEDVEMREPISEDEEDRLSDLSGAPENPEADVTLANSTLFIRNAIWWGEMCKAVANGDPGRVWEILKLWIFTFVGSGNPYYSQYLLKLYCNFKWEFSPKLRHAILMNWVVNLYGEPGKFIEMDLMQEHFNFWLEDMAQHKGKEFQEPFYRRVLSVNVHHFLRLKDEMENVVFLKARTKKHSTPHLNNELKEVMKHLREAEVNCRRPGRHEGFEAVNDFTKGLEILKKEKIKKIIM